MNKTDTFFQLLGVIYGVDTLERKWPTDMDKQVRNKFYEDKINALTLEEIKGAIDNASAQKAKGIDEFLFLDVDLIIGGAKRYGNASHRKFLLPPDETKEEKRRKRILAMEKMQAIRLLI